MTFTDAEIAQAWDTLDWMELSTIIRLRRLVAGTVVATTRDHRVASAEPSVAWSRETAAIFYLLYSTSDTVLERAMQRQVWDASTH